MKISFELLPPTVRRVGNIADTIAVRNPKVKGGYEYYEMSYIIAGEFHWLLVKNRKKIKRLNNAIGDTNC